jgi:heparosan-N-sulfate-glucuronate 5-epimerase
MSFRTATAESARPAGTVHRPTRDRVAYLARIARVYANRSAGPLSFWHEQPQLIESAFEGKQYFMRFQGKAEYRGPFDRDGVPLLDYQGDIGPQHNPIAIAQYGLARFNRWCETASGEDEAAWRRVAAWLERNLVPNNFGVPVWMHRFDWPYRERLKAPWYSGLAQGSGLSMLVRAAKATGDVRFSEAAHKTFESLRLDVSAGGVLATDNRGRIWIEEYLVDPPSHILNGFVWALWGVYDYARWSGSPTATRLFQACVSTIESALPEYDTGRWSLYELPAGGPLMPASRYYHELHIVQLRVLDRLTGIETFGSVARRWQRYLDDPVKRTRALVEKAAFKLLYY